jgi:hypothetical protein
LGLSPRSREFGIAGALVAAATVVGLYASEAALRWLRPDPGFAAIEAIQRAGRQWDARSRIQVVEELRARGVDAVSRSIPAALLERAPDGTYHSRLAREGGRELLPLGGIARKTVVLCNELGDYAIYESDEQGYRNPTGLWDRAPVELVLIGDSFTIGECVPPGANLGDLIRAHHPLTINLGMGGDGPLLELATLTEYGPALRPQRVLWFYFENDLWWFDLGINKRAPLLLRYLEPGFRQGLLELQPEIDARLSELWAAGHFDPVKNPLELMDEIRGRGVGRAWRFARLAKLRETVGRLRHPPDSPADREAPDLALFESILTLARDRTASWGGTLDFVYLPGVWNFDDGIGWRPRDDRVRTSVLEIAKKLGLTVIDAQPAMARHEDPRSLYSFRGSGVLGTPHLNPSGYAFVTRLVLDRLGGGE